MTRVCTTDKCAYYWFAGRPLGDPKDTGLERSRGSKETGRNRKTKKLTYNLIIAGYL